MATTTATATTTTIADQAALVTFLLPWVESIGDGGPIPSHVAREIETDANRRFHKAYQDGTYEYPYRDSGGWDSIAVDSNDTIRFGNAVARITSTTNMAPCARDRGVVRWAIRLPDTIINPARVINSPWSSPKCKEAARELAAEMLRQAGNNPIPQAAALRRAEDAGNAVKAAWAAVRNADARAHAANDRMLAVMVGLPGAPDISSAEAEAAVKEADTAAREARRKWRLARERLIPALRDLRLAELATILEEGA